MRSFRAILGGIGVPALVIMVITGSATAHVTLQAGTYKVALGWANEPAYTGELNAVEVLVADANDNPVTDLGPDDLHVTVSAGGQTSDPFAFAPAFDQDEGIGTPGDYRAPVIPTIPGDYTFHLTGSVHGAAIDQTATSSDQTFDSVTDPTAVQFPNAVPAAAELATRIDRVESRSSSATSAALLVGGGLGAAGIIVALIALLVAIRARRRPTA